MQKTLLSMIDKLSGLVDTAQEKADSDNEKTASKYADIPDHLETAISALQEAVDALSDD